MKGVTTKWLEEQNLVELRPGVYGRKPNGTPLLNKALGQSLPPESVFSGSGHLKNDSVVDSDTKCKKSNTGLKNKPVKKVTGYIEDPVLVEDLINSLGPVDVYIPVQPISSKNSKEISSIYIKGGNGKKRTILRKSDAALNYEELATPFLQLSKLKFAAAIKDKPKPYFLYFTFIMSKRVRFDFTNMAQLVMDLMQDKDIDMIEDDDFSNVVPVFNHDVYLSKSRVGMIIQVINGITIIH